MNWCASCEHDGPDGCAQLNLALSPGWRLNCGEVRHVGKPSQRCPRYLQANGNGTGRATPGATMRATADVTLPAEASVEMGREE